MVVMAWARDPPLAPAALPAASAPISEPAGPLRPLAGRRPLRRMPPPFVLRSSASVGQLHPPDASAAVVTAACTAMSLALPAVALRAKPNEVTAVFAHAAASVTLIVRTVEAFSDEGCLGQLMSTLRRVLLCCKDRDVLATVLSPALPYALAWPRCDEKTCYGGAMALSVALAQLPEDDETRALVSAAVLEVGFVARIVSFVREQPTNARVAHACVVTLGSLLLRGGVRAFELILESADVVRYLVPRAFIDDHVSHRRVQRVA